MSVPYLFESQVARTPNGLAVECGDLQATYGELDDQASRLAGWLQMHGIREDSSVALCCERSIEMVVAALAILKAGAGYVPLDPSYPEERLALMLNDSRAELTLVQRSLRSALPSEQGTTVCLDEAMADSLAGSRPESVSSSADSLAYVLFTSGSTGRPKGVAMPHGPVVNLLQWQRRTLPLDLGERVLQFAPLSFDVSFQEMFTTLCEGGTLVLIDEALRRDPERLLACLVEKRIQRLFLPFVALQQLAEAAAVTNTFPTDLKDVISAGEQLQITDEVRDFFSRMPGVRLHNHYGPTETHVVTANVLTGDPAAWPSLPSIGHPIDGVTIHLLDEDRKLVGDGTAGEICLSGVCVARGYLNDSQRTEARFLPDPFQMENRMYRTGDLARRGDDGELELLGRADDQVKIRGYRVELGEVECALRCHPGIKDCAIAAKPRGAEKVLIAYYQPRAGSTPTPEGLRSFLLEHLPDPLVPSLYVKVERFALTPSGKLDRRALPAVNDSISVEGSSRVPPSSELERTIAAIWEKELGILGVGVTDSFFAAGGTSLMLTQVHRKLRTQLGKEMPVALLFQYPTIRQLAEKLTSDEDDKKPQAAVADRAARQREAIARRRAVFHSKSK